MRPAGMRAAGTCSAAFSMAAASWASGWADGSHLPALAAHPDVGLVVVSVKASGHAALIRAALDAVKHIGSERPLGVDADEASKPTGAATAAGVVHAVVLQGYHSPSARFAADLLVEDRIGTLESVALVAEARSSVAAASRRTWRSPLDPAETTDILTSMAGQFLAPPERVAGPLAEVSARLPRAHDHVLVAGTERTVPNAIPATCCWTGCWRAAPPPPSSCTVAVDPPRTDSCSNSSPATER
ncbi:Gfo/Idh/MocA family oxidoreductase [Nonomuraea wenchangensis]|uniref:Gfo/Idh/MocA family oxidoreductase n=1 Tax=Nonomuraea wenchangensis TaxID=568860 RepID=UPI00341C32D6